MRFPAFLVLILSLTLTACGSTSPVPPTATATLISSSTATSQPTPTPTPTITPLPPTSTPTLAPVCEPFLTFCIEDGHFLLQRPIAPPNNDVIDPTYRYGTTEHGTRQPHHGVEFPNAQGTPVLAAADGKVVVAQNDKLSLIGPWTGFYGNVVVVQHKLPGFAVPIFTLYGHLFKIDVQVGQQVKAGDQLGEVGATGTAIGSHLHFEVREGSDAYTSNRNPELWLVPRLDQNGRPFGVLVGKIIDLQGNTIRVPVVIQYYPDPNGKSQAQYEVETYAPEKQPVRPDDAWDENFSLGALPAGKYRVVIVTAGRTFERWVDIQPGKVTQMTLPVN